MGHISQSSSSHKCTSHLGFSLVSPNNGGNRGGQSPPVRQFVEGPFNRVSLPVELPVVFPGVCPVGPGGNDGFCPWPWMKASIELLSYPLLAMTAPVSMPVSRSPSPAVQTGGFARAWRAGRFSLRRPRSPVAPSPGGCSRLTGYVSWRSGGF